MNFLIDKEFKLAGKINADKYYDYYIKNCN